MPDTAILEEKPPGFDDVAKNNAEVAAKLASQDIFGQSTAADTNMDTSSALDAIVAKRADEKAAEEEVPAKSDDKPTVTPAKTDEKPAVVPEVKVVDTAPEEEAQRKKSDDFFKDSPGLPPNASPKSSEAFAAIKIKAAQELSAREKIIEDLKKEKSELEEKLKSPIPADIEKELASHREWRAKLDVDADPKFKEFDKTINSAREFIYAQLKRSPAITDEVIAQIKKHGGPEMVNMTKIHAEIKDDVMKSIIDSQVSEIERAKWQKEEAIKTTKVNIAEYVAEREKAFQGTVKTHNDDTQKHFAAFLKEKPGLAWFAEKTVDPKANEADRAFAEDHNKFVVDTRKQLDNAFLDDTPHMRAVLLAGMAQLLHLQRVHEGVKGRLTTVETELKEANDKLGRFTKASTTRLRESGAAPGGKTADQQPKESDVFNKRAGDSIDEIAKKIVEERAAAGK